MSRAWASLRPTSLLALAGGISLIRELISTGNGSESAKCSHGSPSGNDMTSGNREKDTNATNDSPAGCSSRSMVRPFSTWPSSSASISPVPHRRRWTADGGGSPTVPASVCRNSQAISSLVACWARIALDDSARPSRSDCSVQRASSASLTASSVRPSACSPPR